jgi:hypoxanthine phosphoribosyltransferase
METLITAGEIAEGVARLGQTISQIYRDRPLTVLGVLKGSVILVADLIRAIDVPHQLGFICATSYRGAVTVPGALTIDSSFLPPIEGRDVLLVDDIFDTGRTLVGLLAELKARRPSSIRTIVLLWKEGRSQVDLVPDYYGFKIPDVFVVGYGLDYNDDYRHLPWIAKLPPPGT